MKASPLLIIALMLPCLAAPRLSEAETPSPEKPVPAKWIPQDNDLRILEIRVDNYTFDDVIGAYKYRDVTLVPLGTLAYILDLAVEVGPTSASGFVIEERNTFNLDTTRNEVIIQGRASTYPGDMVKVLDDDIYVEAGLLGKWFDMSLDIDLYASSVRVRSEKKLPFLARIEREKRIAKTLANLAKDEKEYPRHHEPYRNYTLPFVDQTLSVEQRYTDSGDDTIVLSTTHATADLFQHESNWYLTMNDEEGVDDYRVTFGRTDTEGGLLGALNAREYKFGHITQPRIGLINLPGKVEYGAVVSSYPIGRQSEYDRHRFTGELLPGWEVELYRNNALIGYQQTPVNGQYDFVDVPLLFGSNHFRLVFYGPRGEIRELENHFELSQAMTRKGEQHYRISSVKDEMGENRATIQYDYGLTKKLSGNVNLVTLPLDQNGETVQHNYTAAGLTGYWERLLASMMVVDDTKSGNAFQIDLQTRIDSTSIRLKDIHLDSFDSEEFRPGAQAVARRSQLQLNTAIPASMLPRIPFALRYQRDEYESGDELIQIMNMLSMSTHGVAMTNEITHQQYSDQPAVANGNFRLSSHIGRTRFRSSLGYAIEPEPDLTTVALTLEPGRYRGYHLNFGLNHSLQQDLTEYSATASKTTGKYGLSLGARYNTNDEITLSLNLSAGFGYEPRKSQWQSDARTMASLGSISAHFFIDMNQDGIFDPDDEPLEGIGVRVNGGYNAIRSDSDGILFLTGIQPYSATGISIAEDTLVDPLWRVALDGVEVTPRPGHAISLNFPIFMSGEVDGTVYLSRNGKEVGVGNVTVELVDKNNRVVATTKTAYDGFYILSKAPLGDYQVRINQEQLNQLGLRSTKGEAVAIKSQEPYINGVDFYLELSKGN